MTRLFKLLLCSISWVVLVCFTVNQFAGIQKHGSRCLSPSSKLVQKADPGISAVAPIAVQISSVEVEKPTFRPRQGNRPSKKYSQRIKGMDWIVVFFLILTIFSGLSFTTYSLMAHDLAKAIMVGIFTFIFSRILFWFLPTSTDDPSRARSEGPRSETTTITERSLAHAI